MNAMNAAGTVNPGTIGAERLGRWALTAFALFAVASIAMQNLIFLAAAAWLYISWQRRAWIGTDNPISLPLLILGAVLVAASLFEGSWNGSLFGVRKTGLILVFFVTAALADQPVRSQRLLEVFTAGAVVCALWSILAHLGHWDSGRARSFSGDYMAAGGMYMLALVLAFAQAVFGERPARRRWLAACVPLFAALLFTYTRSSWLGAAAALLLIAGLKDWRWPAAAMVLLAGLVLLFPNSRISRRVFELRPDAIQSNLERRYMFESGLRMFLDRPWLGYGVDNLNRYYSRYVNPKAEEQTPPHVHNTVLQLGLNGGLVAVAFFLWWVAAVLRLGWGVWVRERGEHDGRAAAALGLTAGFGAFTVNGLFEFNFGTAQVISIMYFLTGLLPALSRARAGAAGLTLPSRPRFLFIRPRFLGDVLLASAIPRLIKRDHPGATVDLLTEPGSAPAAAGEPEWDRILTVPRKGWRAWWKTVREIRRQGYTVAADLFGNPRSAQLTAWSGAEMKIGPAVKAWGLVYHVRTQPDRSGPRPAWEAYFDILRSLGMRQLSMRPRWVVDVRDQEWARRALGERRLSSAALLGIFPGATHTAKRWPLPKFVDLAKQAAQDLKVKPVFVFGPLEKDLFAEYQRSGLKLSQAFTQLTAGQLAALWSLCRAVVSNDAFPMHLGPAVNTPTLGLFGPGEPKVWFPYAERSGHRYLHVAPDCWPCHRGNCADNICWRELSVEQVFEQVQAMLRTAVKV